MTHAFPDHETARLNALLEYQILDTGPVAAFDDLVKLTATLLEVPVAIVSLVDAERQWCKAKFGTDLCGSAREVSFCAQAIKANTPLIVNDATKDPRFSENPFVTGPVGLRFYVGVPLVTKEGFAIGTLCAIDTVPRQLTPMQIGVLETLARQVVAQLDLWKSNRSLESALRDMEFENSERVLAIHRAQRSAQYTDDILGSLASILIVIGVDGRIQRWNKATALAFGIEEAFVLGAKLETLPIAWNIRPVIDALDQLTVEDEPRRMDDLYIGQPSGEPRIFGLSVRKLILAEETVSLIVGADITARRAAEEAARLQELRYGELVANVTDVIFNVDAAGCLLFLNHAWEDLTGYTVEETLGRSAFDFVAPEDRSALFQQQILKDVDQEVEPTAEFRLIHKSGEIRWVEAHVHRQRDEAGNLYGSTGTLQDVTDRHRADIGEAEQAKFASFLTSLSSEFINLRKEEMDRAGVAALRTAAEYLNLDRSVVCVFSEDRRSFRYAQGWSNDSFDFESSHTVWHQVSEFPTLLENMVQGETVVWRDIDELGNEWISERDHAISVGVSASVFIPLSSRGLVLGFAAFSRRDPVPEWAEKTVSLLKIVATVFANTLLRFRTDAEVEWLSAIALAESENILRSVLNSAPIAMQAIDRSGAVTLCEGRGFDVLGLTADLALGGNIVDLYREMPHLLRHFVRALAGETFTIEEEWGNSTLEIHFSPMVSPEGECAGTIAVAIDVTQRVQADAAARIRDRAIAASSNGITICDASNPDFPIIYANDKFLELTGYSEDEILGRNCRFLQNGDVDQAAHLELRHALQNGLECRVSLRNYRKDGTMFWNDLSIYPVRDASGRVTHYVGEQNDITVRKGLESQLHRAQKMESIGHLAAGVAHEINTPIQYVGDNLRFLSQSFQDFVKLNTEWDALLDQCSRHPKLSRLAQSVTRVADEIEMSYLLDEVPKALSQSLDGVSRVVEIVQSMKVFSHPGAIGMEPTDLNRCIESTLTVCRNEWRYVAQVVKNLDRTLPPVECYPGELNQTILNLVVNAAHAIGDSTKKGSGLGLITVSSRMVGPFAEIEIRDTGDGIPGGNWSKIFDPFFTTKAVGRGTGQGLAIVHSVIVDHHGGTIDFETGDQGTNFILRIPITATNHAAKAA